MEDKKNNKISREDFLRYHSGKMQGKERNAFERRMQKDPFIEEAAEGYENISAEDALHDLNELNQRLSGYHLRKNRMVYFRIAAAVAALLLVSGLFYYYSGREISESPSGIAITEKAEMESPVEDELLPAAEPEPESSETIRQSMERAEKAGLAAEEEMVTENDYVVERDGTIANKELQETKDVVKEQIKANKDQIVFDENRKQDIISAAKKTDKSILTEGPTAPMATIRRTRKAGEYHAPEKTTELKGQIVSAENKDPLPGVNVTIKGSNLYAVTDSKGMFSIPVRSDTGMTLIASYTGRETEEFRLEAENDVIIDMEPSDMSLEEVVVVNSFSEAEEESPKIVAEIEIDNLKRKSSADIYPEGGKNAFEEYVETNMKLTPEENQIQKAVVVIKFAVGPDGKPEQFEIIRSPSKYFSDEVIRLLKEGPSWETTASGERAGVRLKFTFNKED